MWRLQGPAGLQVRLVGGGLCGDWGNFLLCSALLPPYAGVLWGYSLGDMDVFHSFQTSPLWLLPHCFPPLHPYISDPSRRRCD